MFGQMESELPDDSRRCAFMSEREQPPMNQERSSVEKDSTLWQAVGEGLDAAP